MNAGHPGGHVSPRQRVQEQPNRGGAWAVHLVLVARPLWRSRLRIRLRAVEHTGRSSATRPEAAPAPTGSTRSRSAITVAGIVGGAANNSRIPGSTASTIDPAGLRSYFGGASAASAARTVFRETPCTLTIALIGILSDRCNRRISAQSSTENTPVLPGSVTARVSGQGVELQMPREGQVYVPSTDETLPRAGSC